MLISVVFTELADGGYENLKKIALPSRSKAVTLFVNSGNDSEPTIENETDGHSNDMFVKLYLDRLGPMNQILLYLGQLSELYVVNIQP